MKKKVISVLLIAAMTISLLSGCSDKGTKDQGETKTDEPYHLTFAYIGNEQKDADMVQKAINELTLKELNMTVDIIQLGYGDYNEKLKLMLAGGDPLDVFPIYYTYASSYINNGQIVNLNDLMESAGKGVVEALGEDLAYGAQIGDFLYGFPAQKESNELSGIVMRKDLIEKYDIDVDAIKEVSDLTPIFEKVHAGEPTMVMMAGYNMVDKFQFYDLLSDGFGCIDLNGDPTKVVNYYETDTYMETCKQVRDWYKAGYILPDAATTTETNMSLMKAGNLFSYVSAIKPGFLVQEEIITGNELETAYIGDNNWLGSNSINFFNWGIANNSQDPEKAMEFLSWAYNSSEFMNLINWGIEGTHYVFENDSDKVITFPEGIDASNATYNLNIGWELPNQFIGYVWSGNEETIWDQYKAFNNEAEKTPAFGFLYDSSNVQNELTALVNVQNEYKKALETGSVDPEEMIPKYNAALKAAGIDTVISEKQKQYDAWMAKNK